MNTRTLIVAAALGLSAPLATFAAKPPEPIEKTGEYLSDSALTAKVKTALLEEKNLKSLGIKVESTDGVVTLSGTVPSPEAIREAGEVAKSVNGVKDVHNAIELKPKSAG
jgi:osmotically-inducible protein OsmY